jgi:hypothetical protein
MSKIFSIQWDTYELSFESKFLDFYITNELLTALVVVLVVLRARKLLKTRKANKRNK